MTIRKTLAALAAACLVLGTAGCGQVQYQGGYPTTSPTSATSATSATQAAETTAATAAPAPTAEDGELAPPPMPIDTEPATEDDPTAGMGLTEAYYYRARTWDGAVEVTSEGDVSGVKTRSVVTICGDCHRTETYVNGRYIFTSVGDGSQNYYVNDNTSNWAYNTSDPDFKPQYDPSALGDFVGSGTEEVNGTVYRYEDYVMHTSNTVATITGDTPDSLEGQTQRAYYNDDGDPVGTKMLTGPSADIFLSVSVEYKPTPDASFFSVPAGYTEVDESAFSQQMLSAMTSAMLS